MSVVLEPLDDDEDIVFDNAKILNPVPVQQKVFCAPRDWKENQNLKPWNEVVKEFAGTRGARNKYCDVTPNKTNEAGVRKWHKTHTSMLEISTQAFPEMVSFFPNYSKAIEEYLKNRATAEPTLATLMNKDGNLPNGGWCADTFSDKRDDYFKSKGGARQIMPHQIVAYEHMKNVARLEDKNHTFLMWHNMGLGKTQSIAYITAGLVNFGQDDGYFVYYLNHVADADESGGKHNLKYYKPMIDFTKELEDVRNDKDLMKKTIGEIASAVGMKTRQRQINLQRLSKSRMTFYKAANKQLQASDLHKGIEKLKNKLEDDEKKIKDKTNYKVCLIMDEFHNFLRFPTAFQELTELIKDLRSENSACDKFRLVLSSGTPFSNYEEYNTLMRSDMSPNTVSKCMQGPVVLMPRTKVNTEVLSVSAANANEVGYAKAKKSDERRYRHSGKDSLRSVMHGVELNSETADAGFPELTFVLSKVAEHPAAKHLVIVPEMEVKIIDGKVTQKYKEDRASWVTPGSIFTEAARKTLKRAFGGVMMQNNEDDLTASASLTKKYEESQIRDVFKDQYKHNERVEQADEKKTLFEAFKQNFNSIFKKNRNNENVRMATADGTPFMISPLKYAFADEPGAIVRFGNREKSTPDQLWQNAGKRDAPTNEINVLIGNSSLLEGVDLAGISYIYFLACPDSKHEYEQMKYRGARVCSKTGFDVDERDVEIFLLNFTETDFSDKSEKAMIANIEEIQIDNFEYYGIQTDDALTVEELKTNEYVLRKNNEDKENTYVIQDAIEFKGFMRSWDPWWKNDTVKEIYNTPFRNDTILTFTKNIYKYLETKHKKKTTTNADDIQKTREIVINIVPSAKVISDLYETFKEVTDDYVSLLKNCVISLVKDEITAAELKKLSDISEIPSVIRVPNDVEFSLEDKQALENFTLDEELHLKQTTGEIKTAFDASDAQNIYKLLQERLTGQEITLREFVSMFGDGIHSAQTYIDGVKKWNEKRSDVLEANKNLVKESIALRGQITDLVIQMKKKETQRVTNVLNVLTEQNMDEGIAIKPEIQNTIVGNVISKIVAGATDDTGIEKKALSNRFFLE